MVLKQAANVKYGQFLEPGQTLLVTAEIIKSTGSETKLKTSGTVDGQGIVSARLTLAKYNLADQRPDYAITDNSMRKSLREQLRLLYRPDEVPQESAT